MGYCDLHFRILIQTISNLVTLRILFSYLLHNKYRIIEELTGNYSLTLNSLLLTTKEDVLTNQYVIQFYDCVK